MTLILAYQDRGITRDITIQDSAGDTIIPGVPDAIRAIIGREGETAKLTVTGVATATGSVFTKDIVAGVNRLRLDATDLAAILPGTYTLFVDFFDAGDGSEWKNVDRQVIQIEGT